MNDLPKEEIPIFEVVKKDGKIKCRFSEECLDYELYGFLKCLLEGWEKELIGQLEPSYDKWGDYGNE